jgi:hypothetical protein
VVYDNFEFPHFQARRILYSDEEKRKDKVTIPV